MTAPADHPAATAVDADEGRVERIRQTMLRAILGDTDGGLVQEGDLPAGEIGRLIAEEAAPAVAALAADRATTGEAPVQGSDELREELVSSLRERLYGQPITLQYNLGPSGAINLAHVAADAVLALPAVQRLLAAEAAVDGER